MTESKKTALPEGDYISFVILVNGKEINSSYQVSSIMVEKEFSKISSAEIKLLDGDVSEGEFNMSNGDEFIIGNEVEIQAGYDGNNETIFKGIILKHAIKADEDSSYLIVTAKHKACKMAMKRTNAMFNDMTDSDIIAGIAQKYGLTANVESTGVQHESLTQFYCTDWDFINTRAEANALLFYTGDDKVVVQKPDLSGESKLDIHYGSTIFDFEAESDGRTSFADYKATSWSFTDQKMEEVSQKTGVGETEQGNLSSSTLASALGNESYELIVASSLKDPGALSGWLENRILYDNLSRINGSVRIYGFADINPGDVIDIQRLSNRFNGKTIVSGVEHVIGEEGWQTSIRFGLDATLYSRKYDDIHELKASGMLPAVNGLQVGQVMQIEDDPLGEDRVQVAFPHFTSGDNTFWARVATLDAGNERGIFFRPEVGDEVVVGFFNDHPNDAVILGMLHSSSLPAPVKAEKANYLKGIYTREKIKLEFDDEKKSLVIETPGGNNFCISDDAKGISMEDQNGNKITLNDSGIVIESAKALSLKAATDVTIEGTNINIKANAAFKAEGASTAEVSTSGSAVLKGSIVQIN